MKATEQYFPLVQLVCYAVQISYKLGRSLPELVESDFDDSNFE